MIRKIRKGESGLNKSLRDSLNYNAMDDSSKKTIGTFCEKCRMPYCICKPKSTIIKDMYNIDTKYDFVHNDGSEVKELANEPYFLTVNEAMNWLYKAQKGGDMDGYCLELKTYYFPNDY